MIHNGRAGCERAEYVQAIQKTLLTLLATCIKSLGLGSAPTHLL